MALKQFRKAAGALSLAFALAAGGVVPQPAYAARNTEPYSCQINGRVYNPLPASIVVDSDSGEIVLRMDVMPTVCWALRFSRA